VTYAPRATATITPELIDIVQKQAQENTNRTVTKHKVKGTDAATVSGPNANNPAATTDITYVFSSDYLWTITLTYSKGSELDKAKNAIIDSFVPKPAPQVE